ncbi:hypothetical protein [Sulfurisphaera tokodaii]|uniref:Uncharacterized protein n=2 Tax=Sulfurisphaera tokodaii TaxID=111955 RepID=Q974X9_SULTO|nr:hypothetical protein [Sulfurisphaera tokodaii]BAB65528.1 hypothetical protein STK_05340 [Sulfurisphaera tokodaii str. 7]HII74772.1 hypothetical protein [Sulfurisphaera tokodaii]
MVTGNVSDRTLEFLLKFGEKGRIILQAALDCSYENNKPELGDFSYKDVVDKLSQLGYSYDPKMILRALEKDYGILETTYKSSNQHWWKFIDKEQVETVLNENKEGDPKIELIKIKFYSLEPQKIERKLDLMSKKSIITEIDKKTFRLMVFDELSKLTEIYEEASQYEETLPIAERIKRILTLASIIARKIYGKGYNKGFLEKEGKERENNNVNSLRLSLSEDNISDES